MANPRYDGSPRVKKEGRAPTRPVTITPDLDRRVIEYIGRTGDTYSSAVRRALALLLERESTVA